MKNYNKHNKTTTHSALVHTAFSSPAPLYTEYLQYYST